MPKYYCDYCVSYLTHDTMSVRKSHLMGRNHIKYYCDYYELKAKQTGIWNPQESPYEITLAYLNRGAPGTMSDTKNPYEAQESFSLPPPPSLSNFPNPPPSVLRHTDEYRQAIANHKREDNF